MGLHSTFEICEDILRVKVVGEYTPDREQEELIAVFKETSHVCTENGLSNIFMDWQIMGSMSFLDTYEIISRAEVLYNWKRSYRLAVLYKNRSTFMQQVYHFSENVSFNRGFMYKSFNREDEAMAWLYGQEITARIAR